MIRKGLAQVFGGAVALKNFAYESGWLHQTRVPIPVISVGNLSVGGTGKTPMIEHLLKWSVENSLKAGVVSRGYQGRFRNWMEVGPQPVSGSDQFGGDEPTMLSSRFPRVPVFVAPDRVQAIEKLLEKYAVDLIFADDAFQHRRLDRALDLVILDASMELKNYSLLPHGRLREPMKSLCRADFVILNKLNLISQEEKEKFFAFMQPVFQKVGLNSDRIVEGHYVLQQFQDLEGKGVNVGDLSSVVLVSGIGHPLSFERSVHSTGLEVVDHLAWEDHHNFTQVDLKKVEEVLKENPKAYVCTTAKDIVKLKPLLTGVHFELRSCFVVASMNLELRGGGKLYEEIHRSTR